MSIVPLRVTVKTASNELLVENDIVCVLGSTLIKHLLSTILTWVHLPHLAPDSKGMIQISNWKPFNIDIIWDESDSVENTLGGEIDCKVIVEVKNSTSSAVPQVIQPSVPSNLAPAPIQNGMAISSVASCNYSKAFRFDRAIETPILKQWYDQHPFPDKETCQSFADQLNESNFRSNYQKITCQNVKDWFKYHRYFQKKAAAKAP